MKQKLSKKAFSSVVTPIVLYSLAFGFIYHKPTNPGPEFVQYVPAEHRMAAEVYRAGFEKSDAHVELATKALDWMHPNVREAAAIALGRMESERALPALYHALDHIPTSQPDVRKVIHMVPGENVQESIQRFTSHRMSLVEHRMWAEPAIRAAIARIKTAGMRGVARVIAFESIYLFTHPRPIVDRLAANVTFKETIEDILVEERARGCHVAWMAPCFRLDAGGRMRILLADRPQTERIRAMVDVVASARVLRDREMLITMALYREGPVAESIITDRLLSDARADRYGRPGWNHLLQILQRISIRPFPSTDEFISRAKGRPDMFKRPLHKAD